MPNTIWYLAPFAFFRIQKIFIFLFLLHLIFPFHFSHRILSCWNLFLCLKDSSHPITQKHTLFSMWPSSSTFSPKHRSTIALLVQNCRAITQLYYVQKKSLNDPNNHDGVVTHLKSDILECEVKWALRSITTNKASGGDGIPAKLLQILKDDVVKKLH